MLHGGEHHAFLPDFIFIKLIGFDHFDCIFFILEVEGKVDCSKGSLAQSFDKLVVIDGWSLIKV